MELESTLHALGLSAFPTSLLWSRLQGRGMIREYRERAVLWTAGSDSKGLHVVLRGRIRIVRSHRARQHLVHVVSAGSTMGEVPIFGGGSYPATAIAASESTCWVLPATEILHAAGRDERLARLFLSGLARRVRALVGHLEERTLMSVRSRVAASLIGLVAEQEGREVDLPSPQAEWAEDLGTVPQALGRELAQMSRDALLRRIGRGRVELLDVATLERLAVGDDSWGVSGNARQA